jgi:hypothetical protein
MRRGSRDSRDVERETRFGSSAKAENLTLCAKMSHPPPPPPAGRESRAGEPESSRGEGIRSINGESESFQGNRRHKTTVADMALVPW